MSAPVKTPLDRARAKFVQIELELKKSPDFQLYLIAKSHSDRARMKHLLMEIPHFRLWRVLANAVKNVTGTAFLGPQLLSKRFGLLKELLPAMSRTRTHSAKKRRHRQALSQDHLLERTNRIWAAS
jgi:hypothetical protein